MQGGSFCRVSVKLSAYGLLFGWDGSILKEKIEGASL
jgi:hypothetical protein